MNIEIVNDKMPTESSGISSNHCVHMGKKIDFRTGSPDSWCDDLTGDDIAGQDESGRAMAAGFVKLNVETDCLSRFYGWLLRLTVSTRLARPGSRLLH